VEKIKIGIVGVGNCASALIQGIEYYRHKNEDEAIGFMHWDIGGYRPGDIEVVAAFDIDRRRWEKISQRLSFSSQIAPNPSIQIFLKKGLW
jgi:myo-inositol-1-phosphate synthase